MSCKRWIASATSRSSSGCWRGRRAYALKASANRSPTWSFSAVRLTLGAPPRQRRGRDHSRGSLDCVHQVGADPLGVGGGDGLAQLLPGHPVDGAGAPPPRSGVMLGVEGAPRIATRAAVDADHRVIRMLTLRRPEWR